MRCKCEECGAVIPYNELKKVPAGVDNFNYPMTVYVEVCPVCRSDDITEYKEDENETV